MNVNLEQSLAAVVRFIQDNSEEGTQLYFDEIPENFYVPSVYFHIPYSAGRKGFLTGNGNQAPEFLLYDYDNEYLVHGTFGLGCTGRGSKYER